jgi:predicted PurR-regulated permease PerM
MRVAAMVSNHSSRDVARTTLAVLFIGMLIAGSFWVLRPFLLAVAWAAMIVIATWPLMLATQARLWGKRALAVSVMMTVLLLVVVTPFVLSIGTIVANSENIAGWFKWLVNFTIPLPPDRVERLPLIGAKIAAGWKQIAAASQEELTARLSPYAGQTVNWLVAQAGDLGRMLVHVLLTLIITAILYFKGEAAAAGIRRFAGKVAGPRGEHAARLAAEAVRAVALGVVVTAFVQAVLAGIGLAVAGMPYAPLLTALIFMLGIAQLGPAPVMVPTVIWIYWKGDPWWGTVMLAWAIFVGVIDNFMRPLLIKRGASLPLLLIFAGVIGGLIAFGVVGLFIGPVLLAVTYTLLVAWLEEERAEDASAPASEKGNDSQPAPVAGINE